MKPPPPDWQLPPGVRRELWDYLHDADQARTYDERLAGTPLLRADHDFVNRHCPTPGRLLDLGCGTGRVLVPLAQRGHRVLGVDLSEEMLKVAGQKGAAAGANVQLLKANIVELDCLADGCFDCVLCLFSTLGMVAGPEHRRRVVTHAARLLRPGGVFVLHVHNRWYNFWDRAGRRWLLRDLTRSLSGSSDAGDRAEAGGPTLHHFTRREAQCLLTATGFTLTEVCPVHASEANLQRRPGWFTWLEAYGWLIAACKASRRPNVEVR
jgi:SAM-dependent methyltransferase